MINTHILEQLNTSETQLIDLLDRDVREIFTTMVGADVSSSQAEVPGAEKRGCVTAMVGFAGAYNGMISIHTPQKLAMAFTSRMLGMDVTECDDDVHDAIGEIGNMIGGSFKHHFVKDGHEVRLSTPSVISGDEFVVTEGSVLDTLTLMFESEGDHFMVSVYLEANE